MRGRGGIDTSDATATAGDIQEGKTAYVDEQKVTGTLQEKTYPDFVSDATATVDDVRSGKIFYNNAGRQSGNWNPDEIKEYHFKIPAGTYTAQNKSFQWATADAWNISYKATITDFTKTSYKATEFSVFKEDRTIDYANIMSCDISYLGVEKIYGIRFRPDAVSEPVDFTSNFSPLLQNQGGSLLDLYGVIKGNWHDMEYGYISGTGGLIIAVTKSNLGAFWYCYYGNATSATLSQDMDLTLLYK